MASLSVDTTDHSERLQITELRRMPPWRKVALVGEMNHTVCSLALAGLCQRYPSDSPERRARRLADLVLGRELAERAYGPAAERN